MEVKSANSQQSDYTVIKVLTQDCSCSLCCNICGVCVHTYTCTCMDFILHATVCKTASTFISSKYYILSLRLLTKIIQVEITQLLLPVRHK